ncbi:hypothetical protein FQZ97_997820 [compost metagenome]
MTTCTPLPDSAFRYTGSVAVSVLPSPVRISEILPLCSAMPPSSWTSKWRIFMTRLEPSRTVAKASGSRSSSVSPLAMRSLNSCVLARSASSLSFSNSGSSALMRVTVLRYCLRSRSLRLPKIWVRKLVAMGVERGGHLTRQALRPDSLRYGESSWAHLLRMQASQVSKSDGPVPEQTPTQASANRAF